MEVVITSSAQRRWMSAPVAALILLAALQPARAAQAAESAASGASAPKQPLLTAAELQACVASGNRIKADSDALAAQHAEIDKDKTELSATIDALNAKAAALDKKKKDEIDAFNAQSAATNQKIADLDARVAAFNKHADALRAVQSGYDHDCSSRSYDKRDLPPN